MQLEILEFRARDGLRLYGRHFRPENGMPPPRATVLVTHGLGEHSARYGHVAAFLVENGYEVFAYDLRGHGHSEGRRGDAGGVHSFVGDLEGVVEAVFKRRVAAGPLFLFGHSMGGLIVLRSLQAGAEGSEGLQRGALGEVSGAIASAPWLRLAFEPDRWKLFVASLARWVAPGFRQITGMKPGRLSRDAAFLDEMPELHLSHHLLSARLFHDIRRTCARTMEAATECNRPLLLLHGTADPVTSFQATEEFFQRCGSMDKRLRLYPEVLHEPHNDLGREAVLAEFSRWLEEHSGG